MVRNGILSQEYDVNAGVPLRFHCWCGPTFLLLYLMSFLMMLSLILLSMLMMLASTLSVIRQLICSNN